MDNQPKKPVAVVIGVGPGLGASLVRRFAKTYSVAMLARKAGYLTALAGEIRQSGATVSVTGLNVSRTPTQKVS
jgi:short-subunit dehydrogenase